MWTFIADHAPSPYACGCIVLCVVLPYAAFRINRYVHEHTDPPWKRPSDKID